MREVEVDFSFTALEQELQQRVRRLAAEAIAPIPAFSLRIRMTIW